MPLRTASTPATNVVATAPMPGIMTPSFALGGRDFVAGRSCSCPADYQLACVSVRFMK